MIKDSSEVHVQKVHKLGPTVDESPTGNAGENEEQNNCLEETSCDSTGSFRYLTGVL